MWSSGSDTNDQNETVRLYQPVLYGKRPSPSDLRTSFVGGSSEHSIAPVCPKCDRRESLLVHLYVPDRAKTIQVYACNSAACFRTLFPDGGKLHYGGNGIIQAYQIYHTEEKPKVQAQSKAPTKPAVNEWAVDDDDDDDLEDLESKLVALETSEPKKQPTTTKTMISSEKKRSGLPCFELSSIREPGALRTAQMDEDDVGFGTDYSNDKIQRMLAKYMEEEDDEFVLSALRGSGGSGSGGKAEKDERLSAADRAMLTFSDRIKRSPRQVLRYALGGEPLWSIPTIAPDEKQPNGQITTRQRTQPIPSCEVCGCERVFEFQLLPSLLHVLKVDQYFESDNSGTADSGLVASYDRGMDFGNVAVYTCSCGDACCVVQNSVDERPQERHVVSNEPVVIGEDAKFDDDEDEDIVVEGEKESDADE